MLDVNYKVSLHKAKTPARWNINKDKGNIILYIGNIWSSINNVLNDSNIYEYFIEWSILYILMERICLERAFNKIKIKGGRCNPCCVENVAFRMFDSLD